MNTWCKTTFILQLYTECVCEILTELDSLDFEQNGAASSCLPPVTVTAHRDGPTLSSVLLFEQLQLASSHTSWVGCKSPKEVLLEWQCPHLRLKSHPAAAGIELGTDIQNQCCSLHLFLQVFTIISFK